MNTRSVFGGIGFAPRNLCSAEAPDGAPGGGGASTTGAPASSSAGNAGPSSSSGPGAPTPSTSLPGSSAAQSTPSAGTPTPGKAPQPQTTSPQQQGSSPHAPATADESGAADTFNFDEIFTVTDPTLLEAAASAAVPDVQPPAPQPATPEQQPGAQPGQAVPASPAQAPEAPTSPSPKETSPAPSPADPAGLARALIQHESEAIQHMATQFALSEAEIQALETDIIGTLPQMMSKVFVRAQQTMFANLAKVIPAMLEQHRVSTQANQEAENQFFGQWPKLNKASHGALVKRLASAYRMANPQVAREQMMRDVGMLAMMQAGIAIEMPGTGSPTTGVPNGAPVQLPKPAQQSPWQPAGAAPAVSSTPAEGSPWDILGQNE